jgi:tartrate dehydratase alpha subunit/fumarate hydratase class I-like protein
MSLFTPKALSVQEYGGHACRLMERMSEIGVDVAIAAEIETPSCDDTGWCRMVVDLAARRQERREQKACANAEVARGR